MPKQSPWAILAQLPHYLDLIGFALFAPAVIELLIALEFGGNQYAWDSSQVIGLFCGSGVTFLVWLGWNWYKGDDALLPVSVIRRRTIWVSALNYGLLMSTLFGAAYYLPIYFQAVKGVSAILSGVYFLPTIGPQLLMAVVAGVMGMAMFMARYFWEDVLMFRVVVKVGYVPPFALFAAALTAIGTGLYSLLQPHSSTGKWVGFQIITGLGTGAGLQMVSSRTAECLSKRNMLMPS